MKNKHFFNTLAIAMLLAISFALTAVAAPDVEPDRKTSLETVYKWAEQPVEGLKVKFYRLASISERWQYTPEADFAQHKNFNDIKDSATWQETANSLAKEVSEKGIKEFAYETTNEKGSIKLTELKTGLYLVVTEDMTVNDGENIFDYTTAPTIVSLPNAKMPITEWLYDEIIYPKLVCKRRIYDLNIVNITANRKGVGGYVNSTNNKNVKTNNYALETGYIEDTRHVEFWPADKYTYTDTMTISWWEQYEDLASTAPHKVVIKNYTKPGKKTITNNDPEFQTLYSELFERFPDLKVEQGSVIMDMAKTKFDMPRRTLIEVSFKPTGGIGNIGSGGGGGGGGGGGSSNKTTVVDKPKPSVIETKLLDSTPNAKTKLPQTGAQWSFVMLAALMAATSLIVSIVFAKKNGKAARNIMIALSVCLFGAAACVTGYNLGEEEKANAAVAQVMEQIAPAMREEAKAVEKEPEIKAEYTANIQTETVIESDGSGYLGILNIEPAGIELPVADDWSYPQLKQSPCRYTSLDNGGMVVCAHNYKRHFGPIKSLVNGDHISFTTVRGDVIDYTVKDVSTIEPTAIETAVDENYDLVLLTCTLGGENRVCVKCEKI